MSEGGKRSDDADRGAPEDDTNLRLEEKIKLYHLEALAVIYDEKGEEQESDDDEPPGLDMDEFIEAMSRVLGTRNYDDDIAKLFDKLDNSGDGNVDFNELLTYLLMQLRENDFLRQRKEFVITNQPKIRYLVQNHLEPTVCMLLVDHPAKYITISKEAIFSILDSNFHKESILDIDEAINSDPTGTKVRRCKTWIADAVYMPNCRKVAVATSARELIFVDCSSKDPFVDCVVRAFPYVIFRLHYYYDHKNPHLNSTLFLGTETGSIELMTFSRPLIQLFFTPFDPHDVPKIIFTDLPLHAEFVTVTSMPNVHSETSERIRYCAEKNLILSCSRSPTQSLVIMDRNKKLHSYIFKVPKGITCFDFNINYNLVVTGSPDYNLRVWNMYVTQKPMAILEGHTAPVSDLVIHTSFNQIISYCAEEKMLKAWDMWEYACMENVTIRFPTQASSRVKDSATRALVLRYKNENDSWLGVLHTDYFAGFDIGKKIEALRSDVPISHVSPLCGAIYNDRTKQVISASENSNIKVWDAETGVKSLVIAEAHGNEEITALSFDSTGRRLITAARNGTIKIWNFSNGQILTDLESAGEAEITGIINLADRRKILTVGWNRRIVRYDDYDPDDTWVEAECNWSDNEEPTHKDDILASAHCAPSLLATASFDGEIIVWNCQTERMFMKLRHSYNSTSAKAAATRADGRERMTRTRSMSSRPNSRHRSIHKTSSDEPAPVDRMMFLEHRYATKKDNSAILISIEGGELKWWCIFGKQYLIGLYRGTYTEDDAALAIFTDVENKVLVIGDTSGMMMVWDISNYCTTWSGRMGDVDKSVPPLITKWRAHDLAITTAEYFTYRNRGFVLTASLDYSVRMWSMNGEYVGTFGQDKSWILKDPSTWCHPKSPWQQAQTALEQSPLLMVEEELSKAEEELLAVKRHSTLGIEEMAALVDKTNMSKIFRGGERLSLGDKFMAGLERVKAERVKRRDCYGQVDVEKTQRYGHVSSPFQALSLLDMQPTELPPHLPVSERMARLKLMHLTQNKLKALSSLKDLLKTSNAGYGVD